VQINVKSSALSRTPDLAISAHRTTEAEIDEFVDDALAEFEEIRIDAKKALAVAAQASKRLFEEAEALFRGCRREAVS
jgi:hypothetical protein